MDNYKNNDSVRHIVVAAHLFLRVLRVLRVLKALRVLTVLTVLRVLIDLCRQVQSLPVYR